MLLKALAASMPRLLQGTGTTRKARGHYESVGPSRITLGLRRRYFQACARGPPALPRVIDGFPERIHTDMKKEILS
jgi:hypothetical protein